MVAQINKTVQDSHAVRTQQGSPPLGQWAGSGLPELDGGIHRVAWSTWRMAETDRGNSTCETCHF